MRKNFLVHFKKAKDDYKLQAGLGENDDVPAAFELQQYKDFQYKNMTKYEKEIESLSWTVEDSDFKKITRFFIGISKHPEQTNVSKTYLTKDSIKENCPKYFGH